jgi:hypothetical protein
VKKRTKSPVAPFLPCQDDQVKDEGTYEVNFTGVDIGSKDEQAKTIKGNSLDVIYKPKSNDTHKDPAFKVTVVTDKGSQELTSDTTITNTITSIKYELTNASEFKSYDYEIKRDATQIKQGTAQTSGTIATISGADVKSTGDYTLTFKGTYADGTQSKEFNAYKVTYSKPVTNITFKLNIYNQSKTKNGTYGVGDSQMNDFPLNEYLNYNVYIDNYTTDYAKISYTANMGGKTDEKNDKELKDKTILSGEYEPRLAGAKNDFSITVTSVKDKNGNELLAQSQKIKVTVIWAYS